MFDTGAIWVCNVDADADLELLVGKAQSGTSKAFDTVTLVEDGDPQSRARRDQHRVGDPNGDRCATCSVGARATSTGGPPLRRQPRHPRHRLGEHQLEGQFLAPQRGDVDGNGIAEVVTASGVGFRLDSRRILVLDGTTLRVRRSRRPVIADDSLEGIHDLKLRNVDGDPALEVVIGADRLYDGIIEIYDFAAPGTFTVVLGDATPPSPAARSSPVEVGRGRGRRVEVVGSDRQGHAAHRARSSTSSSSPPRPRNGAAPRSPPAGFPRTAWPC